MLIDDSHAAVSTANIETKQNIFGVLTAAKCSFHNITISLSTKKELWFSSHKSFLISQHKVCNAKTIKSSGN